MATTKAAIRLEESLQRFGKRVHDYHGRRPLYAMVKGVDPLVAELEDSDEPLDDDELTLGHTVRKYDAEQGLEVGDTLCVVEMGDGEEGDSTFVAFDVLHDNPVPAGGSAAGGYVETFTSTGVDKTVTHDLGTRDVLVQMHQAAAPFRDSTFFSVELKIATLDTITITEPPAGDWRVKVLPVGA